MTRLQLWWRLLGCGAWCVAGQLWWLLCIRLPRRRFEVDSRTGRAYVWLLCRAYGWYDRQWMEWPDLSGNGNHATQADVAKKPVYRRG